jgi:hypothetical protein
LSGDDNNEEMDVLFVAAPLALWGESALPGAGVDAVEEGREEGFE